MLYSKKNYRSYLIIGFKLFSFIIALTLFLLLIQGKSITPTGKIVERSALRVKSIPNDTNIFINGERFNKNGNLVSNVPIGKIILEIKKDGYTSWKREVKTERSRVKEIFAQLYPTKPQLQKIQSFKADKVVFSNNFDIAFFTVLNSNLSDEIGIWKQQIEKSSNSFDQPKPTLIYKFSDNEIDKLINNPYELLLSNDLNSLILNIKNQNIIKIDLLNNNKKIFLDKIIGFFPDNTLWLSNSSLLINNGNILYELDLNSLNTTLISYNPSSDSIFCLNKKDGIVYWKDSFNKVYKYSSKNSLNIEEKYKTKLQFNEILSIYCSEQENILIIQDLNGTYYLNIELGFIEKIGSDINMISISNNGKNIIFEANKKFFVYNIEETRQNQVARFYKFENTLDSNAFFSKNNKTIIRTSNSEPNISSITLYDSDGKNGFTVANNLNLEKQPYLSEDNNAVFVVTLEKTELSYNDTQAYKLYRIQLLD